MTKMVFILLFLSIFQISFSVKISYEPLYKILNNVSLLSLGSLGDLTLAYDAGLAAGYILKEKGYDAYVVGDLDTLSLDDKEPLNRVNSSPFITAHVYALFSKGLLTAGVVPIFNGKNVDKEVITSLNTRGSTYPIIVESEVERKKIEGFGYKGSIFLKDEIEDYIDKVKLFWKLSNVDIENIRLKILKNSIVWLGGEKKIVVNVAFCNEGLLVFSDEPEILDYAREILNGYEISPGRKPW